MASINTNPSDDETGPASRQRRGHGRVTLTEVAELAGVTSITVSRFLREPGKVAEDTARRLTRDSESRDQQAVERLAFGKLLAEFHRLCGERFIGERLHLLFERADGCNIGAIGTNAAIV